MQVSFCFIIVKIRHENVRGIFMKKIIGILCSSLLVLAGCFSNASTAATAASSASSSSAAPASTAAAASHALVFGDPDALLKKTAAATTVFSAAATKYCEFETGSPEIFANGDYGLQYCSREAAAFKSQASVPEYGWEIDIGKNKSGNVNFSEYAISQSENADETYELFIIFNTDGTRSITMFDQSTTGNALLKFDANGQVLSCDAANSKLTKKLPVFDSDNFKLMLDKGTAVLTKAGMTWSDIADEKELKYYATEYKGE